MTADEIKDCLRELVQFGCIAPSKHCRQRMAERQIQMDDVLNVLLWGEVSEVEYNKKHDSWQCKVAGTDIDGDDLVFVAGLYEHCHTVRCITVY